MRAAVVVGIVALVCGTVDARPKKRRVFAAYIDPAAPIEPPRAAPNTEPLAILFVVQRPSFPDADVWPWHAASRALELRDAAIDEDLVGVMAFDKTVDKVLKPVRGSELWDVYGAVRELQTSGGGDLANALTEARAYINEASMRKVIVLIAKETWLDAKIKAALQAIRDDNIALIVLGDDSNSSLLRTIAVRGNGTYIPRDHDVPSLFAKEVRRLRDAAAKKRSPNARSTIGSVRSASPPPP